MGTVRTVGELTATLLLKVSLGDPSLDNISTIPTAILRPLLLLI